MKHSEVLLVFPQLAVFDIEIERATSNVFPLGLAYIAGGLERAGITVETADMVTDELTVDELMARVRRIRPQVVGISVCTVAYPRAREVAAAVKAFDPSILVVMGGVHVTVSHRETLDDCPHVDVTVIGEGEQTMVELVEAHQRGAAFDGIAGVAFRRDGKIVVTPRRAYERDLDSLPWPSVEHFVEVGKLTERYDIYPVCSGRGCTYTCSFCAAGALSGRAYRIRSPEDVVEEMKHVAEKFNVDRFFIIDDTFTAVPERAYKICELIERELPNARWLCECRTNSVSRHLLEAMARAGCFKMQFGVESGNQNVLNGVLKGTTLQQIEEAVKNAFEAGLTEVVGSFIVGLPGETYESALETIGFALRLKTIGEEYTRKLGKPRRFIPFLASLIPFPKVACTTNAKALGIEILRDDPHAFISDEILTRPRGMSEKEIRELVMLGEMALEHLNLPGMSFLDKWTAAGKDEAALHHAAPWTFSDLPALAQAA